MAPFRILVASDVHAGYGEGKEEIGNDSFDALEETLEHAVNLDVDFVLLGGDLFHENVPTRSTQHKVMSLLRKYCFSDREVPIEFLADPEKTFETSQFKVVNYEDPNLNVGMPVFSIHGNHDDFSGKGLVALDILHDAGLVNLFGKFSDVDNIVVKPILLQKGENKLALYGIGSQRDDRLCRAFHSGNVQFMRPPNPEEWFNILVLHQNRPVRSTIRSTGSHLPISVLPSFVDVIIWGHEHLCEVSEEPPYFDKGSGKEGDGFYIIQPGSTVATSVCEDEAVPKKVCLLEVQGKTFRSKPVPLERSRQVIYETLDLAGVQTSKTPKSLKTARTANMADEQIIHSKLEKLLREAEIGRGPFQPKLPRLRLRVVYSGPWLNIPPVRPNQIGAKYAGRVANRGDVIAIKTVKPTTVRATESQGDATDVPRDRADETTIYDLLQESIRKANRSERSVGLLSLTAMREIVNECIRDTAGKKKSKFDLIEKSVKSQIENYTDRFKKFDLDGAGSSVVSPEEIKKIVDNGVAKLKDAHRAELFGGTQPATATRNTERETQGEYEDSENMVADSLNDSFPGFVEDK